MPAPTSARHPAARPRSPHPARGPASPSAWKALRRHPHPNNNPFSPERRRGLRRPATNPGEAGCTTTPGGAIPGGTTRGRYRPWPSRSSPRRQRIPPQPGDRPRPEASPPAIENHCFPAKIMPALPITLYPASQANIADPGHSSPSPHAKTSSQFPKPARKSCFSIPTAARSSTTSPTSG